MKGTYKKVALALLACLVLFLLTGCSGQNVFSAESGFFYSSDKGHTYGNSTKEYEVGESVYMKVQYKVTSNDSKDKPTQVKVTLSIPKVKHVDAKYMDGQIITPKYDATKNVTTYTFTALASKEAKVEEAVFEFIPNDTGSITMQLVYDDNVESNYDRQSTLKFVNSVE